MSFINIYIMNISVKLVSDNEALANRAHENSYTIELVSPRRQWWVQCLAHDGSGRSHAPSTVRRT